VIEWSIAVPSIVAGSVGFNTSEFALQQAI